MNNQPRKCILCGQFFYPDHPRQHVCDDCEEVVENFCLKSSGGTFNVQPFDAGVVTRENSTDFVRNLGPLVPKGSLHQRAFCSLSAGTADVEGRRKNLPANEAACLTGQGSESNRCNGEIGIGLIPVPSTQRTKAHRTNVRPVDIGGRNLSGPASAGAVVSDGMDRPSPPPRTKCVNENASPLMGVVVFFLSLLPFKRLEQSLFFWGEVFVFPSVSCLSFNSLPCTCISAVPGSDTPSKLSLL